MGVVKDMGEIHATGDMQTANLKPWPNDLTIMGADNVPLVTMHLDEDPVRTEIHDAHRIDEATRILIDAVPGTVEQLRHDAYERGRRDERGKE